MANTFELITPEGPFLVLTNLYEEKMQWLDCIQAASKKVFKGNLLIFKRLIFTEEPNKDVRHFAYKFDDGSHYEGEWLLGKVFLQTT